MVASTPTGMPRLSPQRTFDALDHALTHPRFSIVGTRGLGTWSASDVLTIVLMASCLGAPRSDAATLKVEVLDGSKGLESAVVSFHSSSAKASVRAQPAVMNQVKSEFSPRVMAVTVGSEVSFPNSDKTRHHVYSFSPTKRFELPLYGGSTLAPVTFDVAGTVTVGCNIHDWMIGYIVVLDTPFRAISDASGAATLSLPAGVYQMRIWHERQASGDRTSEQTVEIVDNDNPTLSLRPTLTAATPPRGDDRLRALQEKFRKAKRE